ncbi:uncharacterized protein N0V89_004212 [Didymosphaeria variabile]|uniref:PHD-type domain-containing protein n=1 Tax=Didymosphaeria variabile TaxID=1932322 RepID=A0A9W8XQ00_9PLEO|nr:uncharacterized protein N0V89_004212 [Didymosphaeria variabile]KAJ4356182.1 hypothetical protein N0V89_004212 [Didymosphaeria variabile]
MASNRVKMPSPQPVPPLLQTSLSMPSQDVPQPVANGASSRDPSLLFQGRPPQPDAALASNFGPKLEGTRKFSLMPSPESPPSRYGVCLQQMAGNAVTNTTCLRDYSSYQDAWADAKASANSKKAELEEQMKLAGNPCPDLDILPDTLRRNFTITVDYMFRWRYQVDPMKNDTSTKVIDLQQSEKQPSAPGPQSERQDTPAQVDSAEEIMKIKRELGRSPSASLANYPTLSPSVDFLQSGVVPANVNRKCSDNAPIQILDTSPRSPDHDGDTVADDDSLFGDITDHFEGADVALSEAVQLEAQSVELKEAVAEVDNQGGALPSVTKKRVPPRNNDLDAATTEESKADTEALIAPKPQMTSAPVYFGLYITLSKPPTPAVTYRIQLNTSLGQAESDMKLIASNELTKALAQGTQDDLHLDMEENKIDIVNLVNGSCLSYEIVKGDFTEGKFQSEMELSGRVVDEESHTKRMFEEASARHEQIDGDAMSEAPAIEGRQDESVETLADVSEATEATLFRKRSRSPNQEPVSDNASEQPDSDQDTPFAPPFKNSKVQSRRAGRIESHDKSADRQQPTPIALHAPIKKRGREPEEPTSALAEPPSKKARRGSNDDITVQATNAPTEEVEDPNALYCRCKQPDNDGRQLIGCDGEQCPNNQWVHLECVPEVTETPKDEGEEGVEKWYCPDCEPTAFEQVEESEYEKKMKVGKKGVATSKKATGKTGGAGVKKADGRKGGNATNKRKLIR